MKERERCLDKSVPLIQLVCRSPGYSCWRIHPPPKATQEVERGPHVECEPELRPQHERSLIFKYFKAERRSRPKNKRQERRWSTWRSYFKIVDSDVDWDQPLRSLLELWNVPGAKRVFSCDRIILCWDSADRFSVSHPRTNWGTIFPKPAGPAGAAAQPFKGNLLMLELSGPHQQPPPAHTLPIGKQTRGRRSDMATPVQSLLPSEPNIATNSMW